MLVTIAVVSKSMNTEQPVETQDKLIHRIIFFAAVATPIMTLPQVYQIWFQGNKGASTVTWTSYVILAAIWLYYGLVNKDKPLIVSQSLCVVTYSFVVIGLVI